MPGGKAADRASAGAERLPIFIHALVATGVRQLTSALQAEPAQAREVMRAIAHDVCRQFQRQHIYVPLDLAYELDQRDRDIWAKYGQDSAAARKFTPQRVAELSEEYRLTSAQIYSILKLCRERERALHAAGASAQAAAGR
jgi:Mor family transcriptional regulator